LWRKLNRPAVNEYAKLWKSDDELFAIIQRELFTCALGDVLDKLRCIRLKESISFVQKSARKLIFATTFPMQSGSVGLFFGDPIGWQAFSRVVISILRGLRAISLNVTEFLFKSIWFAQAHLRDRLAVFALLRPYT
jgi:hypothetical protein